MCKEYINYKEPLGYYKIANSILKYIDEDTMLICIGTDKCIGDSFGPIVGSLLKQKKFPLPVFGTLNNPIHALNIKNRLEELKKAYPNKKIIGIDACLGEEQYIGSIAIRNHPIYPGKGVGKSLPEVGTTSIVGIVDVSEKNQLFSARNIRLNFIYNMANFLCDALIHSYYLYSLQANKKIQA